jgi:hypothetical protein
VQAIATHPSLAVCNVRSRGRLHRPSAGTICFLSFLAVYLIAVSLIAARGLTFPLGSDGVSRVGIADRILFSRDPHLAAIGFVWSPLPIMVLLPLVALKPLLPILVSEGLAGTIVSALFMAGAVAQLRGILVDSGVRRVWLWALTGAFALHPMIVLYAANGMSEAPFIFFLLVAGRRLLRWTRTREVDSLVATGFYLALCYLTRYEAIFAVVAAAMVVAAVSATNSDGGLRRRLRSATVDSLLVGGPFAFSFVAWAAASWLLTGSAFEQFTSTYGNQVQLQTKGLAGHLSLFASQTLHWTVGLEPFLVLAGLACLVMVVRRRDWAALTIPAMLGAVFAFMTYAFVSGKLDSEIRYFILAIPLTVVMVGMAVAPPPDWVGSRGEARWLSVRLLRPLRHLAPLVLVVSMLVTMPIALATLLNPANDSSNARAVGALLNLGPLTSGQRLAATRADVSLAVSHHIDSLHLGRGSVLLDDFDGFLIPMTSDDPAQYVTTSDRDFQEILSDPGASGVRYVLIPEDTGLGTLDAVNRAYPGAYANGRGIGRLVMTFYDHSDGQMNWRLYQVGSPAT